MPETSLGIWSPAPSDEFDLCIDLAAMAESVNEIFVDRTDRVYAEGTFNGVVLPTGGTFQDIPITATISELSNVSVASGGGFLIEKPGIYVCSFTVMMPNSSGNCSFSVSINGANSGIRTRGGIADGTVTQDHHASGVLKLDAGMVISLRGWQTSGSPASLSTTGLSISRISI